jgi:hypothetical protein
VAELEADRGMLARYRETRMTVVDHRDECSQTNNDLFVRQSRHVRHQCIYMLLESSGTRRPEWAGVKLAYRGGGGLDIRSPFGVGQRACRRTGTVCHRASEGKDTH